MKKWRPYSLFLLLLISGALLTGAGYAGEDSIYADYSRQNGWMTPALSLVFQGAKDGVAPWELFAGPAQTAAGAEGGEDRESACAQAGKESAGENASDPAKPGENAAENSARTLSKRNLRFSSEGDGAQKIWVDVEVLCHTLENVVSNADRYAEENIWVSVSLQNAIMRVTVEDDGRGFSKAALAKATNPFFKENSGGENLGLGLNICETLCRLHGGGLILSNTDRGGKVELSFGVSVRS